MGTCGHANNGRRASSQAGSHASALALSHVGAPVDVPSALRDLKGDEDDDESAVRNPVVTKNDDDADFDNDRAGRSRTGYYDADDGLVRAYGRAATAAEEKVLTAVVRRYHAAAAGGEGGVACLLLQASVRTSVVEDYGRPPGPPYLRGATCAAVMSRLFQHARERLSGAIVVAAVRVQDPRALVLVGSRTAPANEVTLVRDDGTWKIAGLLGTALP
jgi:hypothetical protein